MKNVQVYGKEANPSSIVARYENRKVTVTKRESAFKQSHVAHRPSEVDPIRQETS